jgi:glycosyltransferase involved in cell wall biosynthesis
MSRAPLAVFAPLPPLRNGIADYVAELAPVLARDHDCVYVIDDAAPEPDAIAGAEIIRLDDYWSRAASLARIPHLYHIGNNPDHAYLLPVAMRRPGVVALHDLSLHYLIDRATRGAGDDAAYRSTLIREFGLAGQCFADQFETFGWRGDFDLFQLPLNRQIVTRAKAVIVHSGYSRAKLEAIDGAPPVFQVAHHLSPLSSPVDAAARAEARRSLGLRPDELLLASLGFITRSKQIPMILRALARLRDRLPRFRYLLAGEPDPHYEPSADIERLGLGAIVQVTGYLTEIEFRTCLAAADIVLNLRHPVGGETSGALIRALGAGTCVVTVDLGSFGEFPDQVLVKLPWTDAVETALEAEIPRLAGDPALRAAYGAAARDHVRMHHDIARSAAGYRAALEAAGDHASRPWGVECGWEFDPEPAWPEPGLPWRQGGAIPYGGEGRIAAIHGTAAEASTYLRRDRGFRAVVPLAEAAPRGVDLVLIASAEDASGQDLRGLLVRANRALGFGGLVVLDLWQSTAVRDGDALARLLLSAGFRMAWRSDGLSPLAVSAWPDEAVGEFRCRAVKVSEFVAVPVALAAFSQ